MIKSINQAVILAGGRGERLRPLTDKLPKLLVKIDNEIPFCDYLLNSLIEAGIKKILFLIGYKGEMIVNHYKDLKNIDINFSNSGEDADTGRRLLNAYDKLEQNFLLTYGDNYWPIQIKSMIKNLNIKNSSVSMTVFSNYKGTGEYGFENNVAVNQKGFIETYDKTRQYENLNGVDIGYFIINKKFINTTSKENLSFEQDIIPNLIEKNFLAAFVTSIQYYFITNLQSLNKFKNFVQLNKKTLSHYVSKNTR